MLQSTTTVMQRLLTTATIRRLSSAAKKTLAEVDCVGWSGSPIVGNGNNKSTCNDKSSSDHNTTTKPTTTFGIGVQSYYGGGWQGALAGEGENEYVDGADEALSIAEALFQDARIRGDPDSPQAQVLRRMGKIV